MKLRNVVIGILLTALFLVSRVQPFAGTTLVVCDFYNLASLFPLNALAQTNTPPTAEAGDDQSVYLGQTASLYGSAFDPDGDPIISWTWSIEEKPTDSAAYLISPYSQQATLTPDIVGTYVVSLVVSDGIAESAPDTVTITASINQPPTAIMVASLLEGDAPLSVLFDGTQSFDPEGESLSYVWTFGDGSAPSLDPSLIHIFQSQGIYLVRMTVTDLVGQYDSTSVVITVNHNPTPTADAGGPYLLHVGSSLQVDGMGTDPDQDPLTYSWTATAGSFDDATLEDPIYTTSSEAGIYELTLTVTDPGGKFDQDTTLAVVYDPDDGFVTGGGWINSPAGAYKPDPSLIGKANFGFVSKYKKGASVPTGNTEFQFRAADMNFHSDNYEWLVVNQGGTNAQYKGVGTINGAGEYKFMLWAGDDALDTFRIRIWEEDNLGNEVTIYDNGFDQAIEGGSIVIHKN